MLKRLGLYLHSQSEGNLWAMTRIHSSSRWRIIALAVAFIALLLAPLSVAPAFANSAKSPVAKYVALGDSYAAGQGAGPSRDSCVRTSSGYASQIDTVKFYNLLRQPACSGATIDDVLATQLHSINRGTTLVTVTAGANDLGITAVAEACATDPQMTTEACQNAIQAALGALASGGPKMAQLISAIEDRSPRATIVVTGYPQLFAAPTTGPMEHLINQAVAGLNAQLAGAVQARAATGTDVVFAPVTFGEHAIGGSAQPWLGFDVNNPTTFMHPTAEGYAVYRDAILAALS